MKVLLLADVPALGKLGEVVNARAGYARNFLFPRGKAERANAAAVAAFAARRAELEKRQQQSQAAAAAALAALQNLRLAVSERASPDGTLYGSVTPQRVADAINGWGGLAGVLIKRSNIVIAARHIKTPGDHEVVVRLPDGGGEAKIVLQVTAQTGDEEEAAQVVAAMPQEAQERKKRKSRKPKRQKKPKKARKAKKQRKRRKPPRPRPRPPKIPQTTAKKPKPQTNPERSPSMQTSPHYRQQ